MNNNQPSNKEVEEIVRDRLRIAYDNGVLDGRQGIVSEFIAVTVIDEAWKAIKKALTTQED